MTTAISRRFAVTLIAGLTAVTLAACAPSGTPGDTAAKNPETSGVDTPADQKQGFPVTLTHAFGETTITQKPERVAAVGWANNEVPIALGVEPVGMSAASFGDDDGDGILPWTEEALAERNMDAPVLFDETDGIPFEDVAATEPDVILAAYSGLTRQDYDTLSRIAPVIAYPDVPWGTTLEEIISMNSEALGLRDEGRKLIDDIRAEIDSSFADHPELKDTSVLFTAFGSTSNPSQVGFYTLEDPRAGFLEQAGMAVPKVVRDASENTAEFWVEQSAERPEDFADVELIISYGSADPTENERTLKDMQADPLLSKIPAIRDGHVAFLGTDPLAASANPSPLSVGWGIDEYFDVLGKALTSGA